MCILLGMQSYEKTRVKQKKFISFFYRVLSKFATKWQSSCQRQATLGVERRKNERNAKEKNTFPNILSSIPFHILQKSCNFAES